MVDFEYLTYNDWRILVIFHLGLISFNLRVKAISY